jgi:hypothetical protein
VDLKAKTYKLFFHLLGLGTFILLNYILVKNAGVEFVSGRQFMFLSVSVIVFYIFYFYIVPLFLKKRIITSTIISFIVITGAIATNHFFQQKYHKERIKKIIERRKESGPPPDGFRPYKGEKPPFARGGFHLMNSTLQILFFVLVSFMLRFVQKWQHDEKEKYVLEKEKSDAELMFLKQQINPHFLFNSLNSIYSLANKKSDLTTEAILKLSGILRYVLYHSEKDLVPLSDEITTIENYIELQRLRLTKKVVLNYDTKGNPETYRIEPLLLMPIFENAFKYGVDSISESFIDIHFEILNGKMYLHLANKIVPQKEKSDEESGIGLKNIKRRLELLYPDKYNLYIEEQEQVFSLKLELTLKK